MKTQYCTATSLDGFIATEDDSLEWLFPLGDLDDTGYPAFIAEVGALAMGSATYEWMLRHADKVAAQTGSPWPYAQPAWIFSSRVLPTIDGANTRFVHGDVRPVHADMSAAAGSKNIWIVGGGDLAGQFFDADLLDESSSSSSDPSPWGRASLCSRGALRTRLFVWFRFGRSARASRNCAMK